MLYATNTDIDPRLIPYDIKVKPITTTITTRATHQAFR
jgi:hypothetical protein